MPSWTRAFRKGLADPENTAKLAELFGSDPGYGTSEDLRRFIIDRYQENDHLVKAFAIKPDN